MAAFCKTTMRGSRLRINGKNASPKSWAAGVKSEGNLAEVEAVMEGDFIALQGCGVGSIGK